MSQPIYLLHGLAIASDIPLGPPAQAGPPNLPDVTLYCGPALSPVNEEVPPGLVVAQLKAGEQLLYTGVDDGQRYVLRIHGACDFVVSRDLTSVTCATNDGTDPELISLFIRGALLAFLLGLGGACVLHASVVETDEGSVAFVGSSGTGKSTLAGLACRDGARFVTDDLLRLSDEPHPSWVGCATELRLRPNATTVGEAIVGVVDHRVTVDERLAVRPQMSTQPTGTLGAVVIPAPSHTQEALSLERVPAVEATLVLIGYSRMQWTMGDMLSAQFDGVARLATTVPVFVARVPWGPPFQEGLGGQLVREALGTMGETE
jgi:hypothetical protein